MQVKKEVPQREASATPLLIISQLQQNARIFRFSPEIAVLIVLLSLCDWQQRSAIQKTFRQSILRYAQKFNLIRRDVRLTQCLMHMNQRTDISVLPMKLRIVNPFFVCYNSFIKKTRGIIQ